MNAGCQRDRRQHMIPDVHAEQRARRADAGDLAHAQVVRASQSLPGQF
jgi:hypothetical protein